tara:strand:+ start:252 stop:722 length:471 start_codon:yes stop_codon:yes gene_type:complete
MFVTNGTKWKPNLMTLEATFWKLLKKHLPITCHTQRIETGSTGLGIPDVNLCWEGTELWIELKIVKGKRVELSPEQCAWHFRRNRAGGKSLIIARDKFDGVRKGKSDVIYIWNSSDVLKVQEQGIDCPVAFKFETPFNWDAIVASIFQICYTKKNH